MPRVSARASWFFAPRIESDVVPIPPKSCLSFARAAFFFAVCLTPVFAASAQDSAAPAAPVAAPPASTQDSSSKRHSKIPPFLIIGTVFNEKSLAFPGVNVRIRRKGERKFRFETRTNSRGEFAVRVPDGIQYEVVVRQKNYKERSEVVTANAEEVQKRLTFRLESSVPAKAGDSK